MARALAANAVVLRAVAGSFVLWGLFGLGCTAEDWEAIMKRATPAMLGVITRELVLDWTFIIGGIGLWAKREWARKALLVALPFDLYFGSYQYAYGLSKGQPPGASTLAVVWLLFGALWLLLTVYLMHPAVKGWCARVAPHHSPRPQTGPPSPDDEKSTPQEGDEDEPAARGGAGR